MKERCRDGYRTFLLIAGVVLVPAIFNTSLPPCHPYITIHFMEMIFSSCTSKTIQNELIDICSNIICKKNLEKISAACFLSIMMDEATNAANNEQLTVSVQYVHPSTRTIEERFLAFSECITGVSGKSIAYCILQLLCNWQLLSSHLVGQTCDGAGARGGSRKAVRGVLMPSQVQRPHPIYILENKKNFRIKE